MLISPAKPSIPLADFGAFRRAFVRTAIARIGLAVALLGLLVAAFVLSRGLGQRSGAVSAPRGSGVLLLDLSSSVGPSTYRTIRRTFAELTAHRERLGLVIFSDTAYEVVPPGTDPVELEPIGRFFRPHPVPDKPTPFPPRLIENPRFFDNPWTTTYHGGTQISSGLRLAERILDRDRIKDGRVVLISDLNESPVDRPLLTSTLQGYERRSIPLQIVDLSRGNSDQAYYQQLLGRSIALDERRQLRAGVSSPTTPFWLAVAALGLILALALNEHWCRRLSWQEEIG